MLHAWSGYMVHWARVHVTICFTSNFEPRLLDGDALCRYSNCVLYKKGPEYKKYRNNYFGLMSATETWNWLRQFNRTLRENDNNKLGCLQDCGKSHSITRTEVVLAVETSICSCPVATRPNFVMKEWDQRCFVQSCIFHNFLQADIIIAADRKEQSLVFFNDAFHFHIATSRMTLCSMNN